MQPPAAVTQHPVDGNGNMVTSQSGAVSWSVINMPLSATSGGVETRFDYTFSGQKIRGQILSSTNPEDRLYLGGAEFIFNPELNGYELDNYQHEEGRFQYRRDEYEQTPEPHLRQYQITDHLGNLAVLFSDGDDDGHVTSEDEVNGTDDHEVLQRHFYYAFGMDMDGTWTGVEPYEDRYRYNHKELVKGLRWYAYGARHYDPAIGRFTGVDPIAEKFAWVTTYNYAEDSPIANIDLWGLQKYLIVYGDGFARSSKDRNEIDIIWQNYHNKNPYNEFSRNGQQVDWVDGINWKSGHEEYVESRNRGKNNVGTLFMHIGNDNVEMDYLPNYEPKKVRGGVEIMMGYSDLPGSGTADTPYGTSSVIIDELVVPAGGGGGIGGGTGRVFNPKTANLISAFLDKSSDFGSLHSQVNPNTGFFDLTKQTHEPVDSFCLYCHGRPHGTDHYRVNKYGIPIDTIWKE